MTQVGKSRKKDNIVADKKKEKEKPEEKTEQVVQP